MSDFQSFLLQSMQLIGLKEDTSSLDSFSNSSSATSNTDLTQDGGELMAAKSAVRSFVKKKLNTIEEPPELSRKLSVNSVKKEVVSSSSRQSSVSSSKNLAAKTTTVQTSTIVDSRKSSVKKSQEEPAAAAAAAVTMKTPEMPARSSVVNNEKADTISQLQQNSMGNISICTTETFISTNSNSTNLTSVTSASSANEEKGAKKYTTIAESDNNNDTAGFPDPPKFITEEKEGEEEAVVERRQNMAKDSISVDSSEGSGSIVCVDKVDYNENKQLNEKTIENKDVIFEICSLTSSINCLDQDMTPARVKSMMSSGLDNGSAALQQDEMQQNITSAHLDSNNAIDESFIDNNGYNNNMLNMNATLMNSSVYDCERDVKSPKPVVESISQRILKKISNGDFSPLKSIFNKHYQNKNVGQKGEVAAPPKPPPPVPPPPVACVDPKIMESYLAKFEEEILRKAKTEILNECKLLTAKQAEKPRCEQRRSEEDVEESLEFILSNDMDNLEKYNSLITRIRFNSKKRYMTLPLLYNYFNERIDAVQISKWLKNIEKGSAGEKKAESVNREEEVEKEPSKLTSKQYLMNKKRELMDKVTKKMHHHKKVPRITLSDNQLYANVDFTTESVTETTTMIKKHRTKKKTRKESPSVDDTPVLNDGFYINDKRQHVVDEPPKRTKKKPQRPKSEVKSIEENSSMLRDVSPGNDLAAFEKRGGKSRSNARKSTVKEVEPVVDEDDDGEDLKVQKVNIRKTRKTTRTNQTLSNDHFYNEINEVELRNTVKQKEKDAAGNTRTTTQRLDATKPKSVSSAALASTSAPSTKKLTESQSATTLKKPSAAETAKNLLRKPINSLAKIKSPERKILYNEWFSIIKKMDNDPKFDLEALVRTRGRFTEHDRISYRDRLQQQKLRSARSEPNFAAMNFFAQNSEPSQSDDSQGGKKKTRSKHTAAKHIEFDAKKERSRPHRTVNLCNNRANADKADLMKSESYSGGGKMMQSKWDAEENLTAPVSKSKQSLEVPGGNLKLTLHKSDVEMIKEILKKKNKNLSAADLNTLALNALKVSSSKDGGDLNTKRRTKVSAVEEEDDAPPAMKTMKTRRVPRDVQSSECENEIEAKARQVTRTRPKDSSEHAAATRRRDKSSHRPLKQHHESGASSSLIDAESKEEDSSLISKCKNLTQIAKTDGAKGLCDELGKMMKGRILKGHSKLVSKINEIGSSIHFEKKHTSSRTEISVSRSPPPRPEPPQQQKQHHRKRGGEDVKQDHIEKWMQNVNSAASRHKTTTRHRNRSVSEDFSEDEVVAENDEDDDDADEHMPPTRRHHRKLSNINEDDGSESRHQSRNMRATNRPRQRKSTHEEIDLKSPLRPAPPKRPPPPKPTSPEVSSVHDRLMRDMNKKKATTRHHLKSNSSQSIESSQISGSQDQSPEPVSNRKHRHHHQQQQKQLPPPLPPPPPRPQSKPKRSSGGYESEEHHHHHHVKYSNTTRRHREPMNAMLEYQIEAHNESHLKANSRHHSKLRSESPSPAVTKITSHHRNRSHQQTMPSVSPDRHRTRNTERQKPPKHR